MTAFRRVVSSKVKADVVPKSVPLLFNYNRNAVFDCDFSVVSDAARGKEKR